MESFALMYLVCSSMSDLEKNVKLPRIKAQKWYLETIQFLNQTTFRFSVKAAKILTISVFP